MKPYTMFVHPNRYLLLLFVTICLALMTGAVKHAEAQSVRVNIGLWCVNGIAVNVSSSGNTSLMFGTKVFYNWPWGNQQTITRDFGVGKSLLIEFQKTYSGFIGAYYEYIYVNGPGYVSVGSFRCR